MKKNPDVMNMPVGITVHNDLDGEPIVGGTYGKEVMLDCYDCDVTKFNRRELRKFFNRLVKLLDMQKGDLHFWDDVGVPKSERQTKLETTGTSAIQFILTSNITVHCLDKLARVYVNIFSCKDFETGAAKMFVWDWFSCGSVRAHTAYRR
jgi:S-adenosylmethionine/arginine decarboxylase-like enzyme